MQKKTEDTSLNKEKGLTKAGALVLFWEFFKIGLFTIGGGAAMIPQMQQLAVRDKGWLTDEEMLDAIALGQSLPGVIAVNMATYVGYRKGGLFGAFMATLGVVLPAFLAVIILLAVLDVLGENSYVTGAFMGIKAAVCGLIGVSSFKLLRQICGEEKKKIVFNIVMTLLSLLAVGFFGITAIAVIVAGIVIGIVWNCFVIKDRSDSEAGEEERP